ncbi:MAG: PAS domain-containing protein, partial [Hymenobacteraceae bacterium]|nr:PAS domain-containing protein [Hymenobacteraceae bacterium]
MSPDLRILAANNAYQKATSLDGTEINKSLFDALPDLFPEKGNGQVAPMRASLEHVITTKKEHTLPALQVKLKHPDGLTEERYWDVCNKPMVCIASGELTHIIQEIHDVTDQVKVDQKINSAQMAYKEMNERFALIAKATSDVIWDWDLLTNQVWWNDGFKTLFGYPPEELEPDASSWTNRIHPEDLNRVTHSIHHAIDTCSNKWNDTYRFRCADGTYKVIYDQGYIIPNEQGQAVRMLGAMQDVTEKVDIEQQLKKQSEHIYNVLNSLPLMIWTATPDGTANFYSQQWRDFTGSDFEEMEAWEWEKFIHPDDVENTKKKWLEAVKSGKPLMLENRFRSKGGVYRWFLTRALPIRNSENEITLWVGSNTDIEAQKQMLTALENSNERFKMLAESIPHIVWSGKPDGYVDYFNQQWYSYTKMSEEETLGLGWGPALHPDDQEPSMNNWLTSMRTGQMYERELRLRDINTEDYRWFLARAQPIRDVEGNIITWYGTATDIHDQKVLREQVEASEKKFRFLTESIPQMVWSANPDGYIDYTNHRWYEYTKMDESSLGFGWAPAIHPDELDSLMATWLNCVATGEKLEFQVRFQDTVAKTYRWFLLRAEPMQNESGQIVKWFGTATDIHDQVLLREKLQASEKQFRFLAESIPQMIWTTRPDGYHDYF